MRRDVLEVAVSQIAVQDLLAFLFVRLRVPSGPGGVNPARGNENIQLTVIIKIEKSGAPLHRGSLSTKAGLECAIGEESISLVVVQGRGLIGVVGFYDVQKTIAVIIPSVHTHSTLQAPVFVDGHSSEESRFGECPVSIIFEQQTRGRIVRNVNVGPTIVVIVGNAGRKTIGGLGLCNTRGFRDVSESSVTVIVIENV